MKKRKHQGFTKTEMEKGRRYNVSNVKSPSALTCLSVWLPPGGAVWEDSEALRRWNLARGSGSLGAGLEALYSHSAS